MQIDSVQHETREN